MTTFAFLGTTEIIVIMVIALLLFGPTRLPELARQIGSAMRELRRMSDDVRRTLDFDEHLNDYNYNNYNSPSYAYTPPSYDTTPLDQQGIEEQSHAALPAHDGETTEDATETSDDPEHPAAAPELAASLDDDPAHPVAFAADPAPEAAPDPTPVTGAFDTTPAPDTAGSTTPDPS